MAFLNTDLVTVFPSARRVMTNVSSRLLSEKSLAGLTNMLIDTDGFIITSKEKLLDSTGALIRTQPIEFNIYGYYFRVNQVDSLIKAISTSSGKNLYVGIELVESGNYVEIFGQDETVDGASQYKGLVVSTEIPTAKHGGTVHYICLFDRPNSTGDNWHLNLNSYFKFIQSSLDLDIDGGEIV